MQKSKLISSIVNDQRNTEVRVYNYHTFLCHEILHKALSEGLGVLEGYSMRSSIDQKRNMFWSNKIHRDKENTRRHYHMLSEVAEFPLASIIVIQKWFWGMVGGGGSGKNRSMTTCVSCLCEIFMVTR